MSGNNNQCLMILSYTDISLIPSGHTHGERLSGQLSQFSWQLTWILESPIRFLYYVTLKYVSDRKWRFIVCYQNINWTVPSLRSLKSYRHRQLNCFPVWNFLNGEDVLVCLPPDGGKSFCFTSIPVVFDALRGWIIKKQNIITILVFCRECDWMETRPYRYNDINELNSVTCTI